VEAHISKLMQKNGVKNRLELSVHVVTHSLVSFPSRSD
jgi:DNA-binding CsgD family transcriptional regulator